MQSSSRRRPRGPTSWSEKSRPSPKMWKLFRLRRRSGLEHSNSPGQDLRIANLSIDDPASSSSQSQDPSSPDPGISIPATVPVTTKHKPVTPDLPGRLFVSQQPGDHQKKHSQDRRDDPLGLSVLHAPPRRSIDIIFIHGLGGTSLRTWCHERDLKNLWPQRWLPNELPEARILTFGYFSHFSSTKEHVSLTLGDFATDLLFRMRYGETGDERLGQVPIVVVAHSMGGLVFKKAFVQGQLDAELSPIVSKFKAVLFLATPHQGTDLAGTLNKILTGSVFGHSPKDYVAEIARGSPTINELNDTFHHYASKLQIFSFYETLATSIGPMQLMIVEKNSSVLGYPGETPQPLVANHHNVCKFTSVNDPNFVAVVGALRTIAESVTSPKGLIENNEEEQQQISKLLGVSGAPLDDLVANRVLRKPGTCEEFLMVKEVKSWLHSEEDNPLLWAHAAPGSGKSTISAYIIDHLQSQGRNCAFFFFRYSSQEKRSLANMLRSLASQMSVWIPPFRQRLIELGKAGMSINRADGQTVWEKLFITVLASVEWKEPIFWVIDGLDEADSSQQIMELITTVTHFEIPIRVIAFSRPLSPISQAFKLAKPSAKAVELPLPDNHQDVRLVVAEELESLPWEENFKTKTINDIASRSHGSFLWASLILKRVVNCHRQDQVRQVLESTPDGMEEVYDRMLDGIVQLDMKEDVALAKLFLSWAIYARVPVAVEELTEAYPQEMRLIMDLKHTVGEVCGQFVAISPYNKLDLVHHSARQYLRKASRQAFSLNPEITHEELFGRCIVALCDKSLRIKIITLKLPKFLPYAATSWAYHLENCSAESDRVYSALFKFFGGYTTLAWIQYLAMSGNIANLIQVSRILTIYMRKRKKVESERQSIPHHRLDPALIESWAADLLKIPAKFGHHLSKDSSIIYRVIPPLTPSTSAIYKKFNNTASAALAVTGINNTEWDDCLARVSSGSGRTLRVAASQLYLAVGNDVPKGSITLWDTNLFREHKSFNTGEHIWAMAFDQSGLIFACYSVSKTFVWQAKDGILKHKVDNPPRERAIELSFDKNSTLMMVSDLRKVYKLQKGSAGEGYGWEMLEPSLLEETAVPEGTFLSTPCAVSFNNDCTHIAVAYRNFPLSIWSIEPPEMVSRLRRKERPGQTSRNSSTGDTKVVWHPSGREVIGIHDQIFKWNALDDNYDEVKWQRGIVPHGIQCSPNGVVFMTSDVEGTIKIYEVSSMSLVYRLTSEDTINQICFSPDSLRFYDLRGSYCNVWEPNCLFRMADTASELIRSPESFLESFWPDADDTRSTSLSSPVSESRADCKPAIVAIAQGSLPSDLLASSNDQGTIDIYRPPDGPKHSFTPSRFRMGIDCLAWDSEQLNLAYSLANGAIGVKRVLTVSTASEPAGTISTTDVYMEKGSSANRGQSKQLLFNESANLLLINGAKKCQIISLPDGNRIAEKEVPAGTCSKWYQHPSQPDHLLCLRLSSLSVFTWQLEKVTSMDLDLSRGQLTDLQIPIDVDPAPECNYSGYFLLRTMPMHLNRPTLSFEIFSFDIISWLSNSSDTERGPVPKPLQIPSEVKDQVQQLIGILPNDRLVFLDRDLWICTLYLCGTPGAINRHYFLPRDWVTSSSIRLCRVLSDGTLLCPTKGEIAFIEGDLAIEY